MLDSHEYIPVTYVTMHSMIWHWLKRLSLAWWIQKFLN